MSDCMGKLRIIAALALGTLIALSNAPVLAQGQQQDQQQPTQQLLTQQEIQQLVAPIALYPDALLAQVLTASTYPLEVAMAAHWSEKNPNFKGAALEDAMQKQPWDPSVKGLTSVPQVLAMMNDKLDWTSQLGEAFLAQPNDVQAAIQALRAKAEATGNLKSSKELRVRRVAATPSPDYMGPPEYIEIESVEPDYVYVPVYDPVVVYGVGYWSPAYVPFFWYPSWWTVGPVFGFGAALFVGPALWYHYNWGHSGYGAIQVNTTLYNKFNAVKYTGDKNWKFDLTHHGNVPFKNTKLQQQFGKIGSKDIQGIKSKGIQKGLTGVQINKGVKGLQTDKGMKGVKSVKTNSGVKHFKTNTDIKSVKTNTGVKHFKTNTGVKTHKDIKGQTGKSFKGIQTGKGFKEVQTGKRVQSGSKSKEKRNH
jgi:hypothetical protein